MNSAGGNIRHLAQQRKQKAIQKFFIAGILLIIPVVLYQAFDLKGISVFIHVGCWIISVVQVNKGLEELQQAGRADQGAEAEESTAFMLSPLEQEGWNIEYNIRLRYWGDADAFLRSPQGNCFVIDTKSDGGTVFFDGTVLMKRYGRDIYPFSNGKDILKAAQGQAASLKEMKGVRYVTPVLCFARANLDIKTIDNKVKNVHILNHSSLVPVLRKLG